MNCEAHGSCRGAHLGKSGKHERRDHRRCMSAGGGKLCERALAVPSHPFGQVSQQAINLGVAELAHVRLQAHSSMSRAQREALRHGGCRAAHALGVKTWGLSSSALQWCPAL